MRHEACLFVSHLCQLLFPYGHGRTWVGSLTTSPSPSRMMPPIPGKLEGSAADGRCRVRGDVCTVVRGIPRSWCSSEGSWR